MQNKPKRLLRLPDVITKTGFKRSSIYAFIKQGKFPAPKLLGVRAIGWVEADIDAWIDGRVQQNKRNGSEVGANRKDGAA